jgi:signal transduction histidine kinase
MATAKVKAMTENRTGTQVDTLALDWLVSNLRWLWLFLATLFVVAESLLTGSPLINMTEPLLLLVVAGLLNGLYAGLLWASFFPNWLAVVAMIFDTIFAILLFVMLEQVAPFLLPIMLFPVLTAGVRWNTEAGLLVALPIAINYALPLLPIFQGETSQADRILALLGFGVNALTLFLAGALPGPFVRQRIEIAEEVNEAELDRLRIANERNKFISDMAQTLSSTLDYRKVLRATIDMAFSAMTEVGAKKDITNESTTIGMVLLFEGDGRLKVAIGRNIARTDQGRRVNAEDGLIGETVRTAETLITHKAQNDKNLTALASTPSCRSAICAPLRAGFNTYGAILFCSTKPNFFNEDHKALLNTFCSQAIIALQNAQLFEDVHREQQKILEKESEARRKLARDLHDGPTQSIAAIVMRLNFIKMVLQKEELDKAYEEIVKVEEIAQQTTQEIRTMLFAMRPVILETQGLAPALMQYAERLNANESFQVSIANHGYDGQLSQEAEGVIFAIVEEAIGNAKKHAQATEIKVSLVAREDSLFVEIKDNGVGFDVERTQSTYDQRTSLGLINIRERAELVGGDCAIESARGKGTAIKVEIPFVRATDMA